MTRHVVVLHGPNLNLLGTREPEIYGSTSLAEIDRRLAERAAARGATIASFQSNSEGALIDRIHAARGADGILINAAGYTHTSVALHDALKAASVPAVEVHLSNVHRREPFRHHSMIASACVGVVAGFGPRSYAVALDALLDLIGDADEDSPMSPKKTPKKNVMNKKKSPPKVAAKLARPSSPPTLLDEVDALAELLARHDLAELEVESNGRRIWLRHGAERAPVGGALVPAGGTVPTAAAAAPPPPLTATAETSDGNVSYITSPFVGTFYRSPGPESAPFVDVGTHVKKGHVLCIVEAMKLMNEIESEVEGTIVGLLVENGQPVEYGEPLFKIKQS